MYRRGESGQITRALNVLGALRGFKHGRSIGDLAAEVATSERTVRRDIAELQDAGFEIEIRKHDRRTLVMLHDERNYSPVPITRRERFTLLAVRNVFDVLQGTPFLDDVNSVLSKLEQRMSAKEREDHLAFGERFVYVPDHGTKTYDGKEDVIDAIQTGILSRKLVRFRYATARGKSRAGYLAPYAMILYRHGLYVLGDAAEKLEGDKEQALFAIERFVEAEHMREHEFERPTALHAKDVVHGSFNLHLGNPEHVIEVVVEFTAEKASLVASRTWHPTQKLERLDDGVLRLSFSCPDIVSVVSWILEWGPHARVVAPPELVAMVTDELDRARARYAIGDVAMSTRVAAKATRKAIARPGQ